MSGIPCAWARWESTCADLVLAVALWFERSQKKCQGLRLSDRQWLGAPWASALLARPACCAALCWGGLAAGPHSPRVKLPPELL